MPQPRNTSAETEHQHHHYSGNEIPWYVRAIWVGFWAGSIGAGNTMVLGGFIAVAATGLIWRFWRPIREFRSA